MSRAGKIEPGITPHGQIEGSHHAKSAKLTRFSAVFGQKWRIFSYLGRFRR